MLFCLFVKVCFMHLEDDFSTANEQMIFEDENEFFTIFPLRFRENFDQFRLLLFQRINNIDKMEQCWSITTSRACMNEL